MDRLQAPELHREVRLRDAVAADLLRRRDGARAEVRPRSTGRTCAAPASGRSATTGRGPSCTQVLKDKFITDTVPPVITASSLSGPFVSANGDGRIDTVTVRATVTGHIKFGWSVARFVDGVAGPAIRSGSVTGKTVAFTWDGRDDAGKLVPDGQYRITVWAADVSNNRASVAKVVTVDRRAAVVGLAAQPGVPVARRRRPRRTRSVSSSAPTRPSPAPRASSTRQGATVRRWTLTASHAPRTGPGTVATRPAGRSSDGRYTLRFKGLDRAGNQTVRDLDGHASTGRSSRSPGHARRSCRASGVKDRFTMVLRRPATVTVAIYQGSTLVRTIWSARRLATGTYGWTWNGKTAAGAYVKPGQLQGRRRRDELDRLVALRSRRHRQGTLAAPPARLDFDRHDRHDRPPAPRHPRPGPTRRMRWARASGSSCRPTTRPRTSSRWSTAILAALPAATVLVVDDGSPDGTGHLADASPQPTRGSASAIAPRSRVSGAPTSMASGSPSPAARARSSRWTPISATTRRRCRAWSGRSPAGDADLVIGSRYTRGRVGRGLGHRPPGHLARRQPVRADRPGSRPERPDRRLQGVARDDPRGRPVRRGPRRRLRLPDRDDVPRQPRRSAHPRGPDHLPRPPRRTVQDEPSDRRRGAGRRRPAPRRGDPRAPVASPPRRMTRP